MEIWKPIVIDGETTDYEVGSLANVRTLGGTYLKETLSYTAYKGVKKYQATVRIKINGKARQMYVKILVATAHCERKEGENVVARLDGPSDHASNLIWTTKGDVMSDSLKGRIPTGADNHRFGTKASIKTKAKMSKAHKGKSKYKNKLICEGRKFDTATAAAAFFKVSIATVLNRVKSEDKEWRAWYVRGASKLKQP